MRWPRSPRRRRSVPVKSACTLRVIERASTQPHRERGGLDDDEQHTDHADDDDRRLGHALFLAAALRRRQPPVDFVRCDADAHHRLSGGAARPGLERHEEVRLRDPPAADAANPPARRRRRAERRGRRRAGGAQGTAGRLPYRQLDHRDAGRLLDRRPHRLVQRHVGDHAPVARLRGRRDPDDELDRFIGCGTRGGVADADDGVPAMGDDALEAALPDPRWQAIRRRQVRPRAGADERGAGGGGPGTDRRCPRVERSRHDHERHPREALLPSADDAVERRLYRGSAAAAIELLGRGAGHQLGVGHDVVDAGPEEVGAHPDAEQRDAEQEERGNQEGRHDADEEVGDDEALADAPHHPRPRALEDPPGDEGAADEDAQARERADQARDEVGARRQVDQPDEEANREAAEEEPAGPALQHQPAQPDQPGLGRIGRGRAKQGKRRRQPPARRRRRFASGGHG